MYVFGGKKSFTEIVEYRFSTHAPDDDGDGDEDEEDDDDDDDGDGETHLVLYVGTETWSLVQSEGSGPRPRWGHGACVWRGGMWIFAGRDNVFSFKDLLVFHFGSSCPHPPRFEPVTRGRRRS